MAEDFIEEIYQRSQLISDMKQAIIYLNTRNYVAFGKIWKPDKEILISIIQEWADTDSESAGSLERLAVGVESNLANPMVSANILENGILRLLYKYMENYKGIDVTEGRWQLKSTTSGYLGLIDCEKGLYIHSLDDPMTEALHQVDEIYTSQADNFVLIGCGLGYLPYQMYKKSQESMEIYILENDINVLQYANDYGVLGRIPEDKLHILFSEDIDEITARFNNMGLNPERTIYFVSEWYPHTLTENDMIKFSKYVNNAQTILHFTPYYEVNFRKNSIQFDGEFSDIAGSKYTDECIVVAAGPSFTDNIEFIRSSRGEKKIIAVSTALKKLLREGIIPDFVAVADPGEPVLAHLDGIEKETEQLTLIAESVSYWKFIDRWRGPKYRVVACGYRESKELCRNSSIEPWNVGGTVSSLALEIGVKLKAKKIYMVGLDLAYPGKKKYAEGIGTGNEGGNDDFLYVDSVDGGKVATTWAFDCFRKDVEAQIEKHKNVDFINCSKHGALIRGAHNREK